MSDLPEFDNDIERLSYELSQANRRILNLEEECDALHEENQELRNRLAEIENQLDAIQDLGREKSTKEEKIAAIVSYAHNVADDDDGKVAVSRKQIQGLTGVCRRYSYDLLDDLPDEYEWLVDRKDAKQYGDLQIDKDAQDRALVVDLERLHEDDAAVNKFTTRDGRKGASA